MTGIWETSSFLKLAYLLTKRDRMGHHLPDLGDLEHVAASLPEGDQA